MSDYRGGVRGVRLRTVASGPTTLTHAWPRWSALLVWAIACAVLTAGLVAVQRWVLTRLVDPSWIELYHFGPALAVGALWLVFRDHHQRPEVEFGQRLTPRAVVVTVVAAVAGGTVVITAMAARDTIIGSTTPLPPLALPLALAIASAVVTALGEETAWRAFLQPELERWWGPLPAAFGVGVIWALWSALVRHPGAVGAVVFGLVAISLSVGIAALVRIAGGHALLLATVCHTAVNLGLLVVLPGRGEEGVTALALVTASVVVGGALWLISCFRPAPPSEGDDDDLDDLDDLDDTDDTDDTDEDADNDGRPDADVDGWGIRW